MDPYATSHFSHGALRHELKTWDGKDRTATAVLLSRIAEFDARKLYLEDGYSSMYAYCLGELHYCEGTASRRIYAAKAARRFPVLFAALAEGRVHLTAVLMLARYLTEGNIDELLAAATHKSKEGIRQLIANRFPQFDLPERLQPVAPPATPATAPAQGNQHSPENVDPDSISTAPQASSTDLQHSPENVAPTAPRPKITPLAPQRFGLQVTIDEETHDLLRNAQALMSHHVPQAELATVIKSALKHFVGHLEKRKFAATDRPGRPRGSANPRYIPAAVRRTVYERDGGQCTYVSESGGRCSSRQRLEHDHIVPVSRGGQSTVENVRLRCRAHNQYAAECVFGLEFMEQKRREARAASGARVRHGGQASSGQCDVDGRSPQPTRRAGPPAPPQPPPEPV